MPIGGSAGRSKARLSVCPSATLESIPPTEVGLADDERGVVADHPHLGMWHL